MNLIKYFNAFETELRNRIAEKQRNRHRFTDAEIAEIRADDTPYGTRIRELRVQRGYTQAQFAEMLDISESTVAKIECGLRDPSLGLLKAMVKCLNADLDYIMFGEYAKRALEREKKWRREDIDEALEMIETAKTFLVDAKNELETELKETDSTEIGKMVGK